MLLSDQESRALLSLLCATQCEVQAELTAFDLECPWAPTLFQTWAGGPVEWTEAGESEREGGPAVSPVPALLSCSWTHTNTLVHMEANSCGHILT